jgi:small subunit ribosomal protein S11
MAGPAKKKSRKNVEKGIANIYTSFNNSIITITDESGQVLSWSSCGAKGFKGSKKSTPFAAQVAAEDAARKARDLFGLKKLEVRVNGPGAGRDSALRAIAGCGINIFMIRDVTPTPHNGCRAAKRRRV